MQVPLMITVDVEDVNDLESIERGITDACRRLPSRAMQKFVKVVEELAESQDPGRLRRKSTEKRMLWMTCGCAEFERRRYTDMLEEKSYVLFDLRTGLCSRQRMTDAAALMRRIDNIVARGAASGAELDQLREQASTLNESTVCEKNELDWSTSSIYASIPRMVGSLLRRR